MVNGRAQQQRGISRKDTVDGTDERLAVHWLSAQVGGDPKDEDDIPGFEVGGKGFKKVEGKSQ